MSKQTIKVAIVDDHQIVIDGIKSLLDGQDNFEITAYTTSPNQMLTILAEKQVDVLMTDIMMPEMNGQDLAKAVRKQFPAVKILALSMTGEGDIVNNMINEADISGYVLKNIGKQELTHALQKIAGGGIYFSDEVLKKLEKFSINRKENKITH